MKLITKILNLLLLLKLLLFLLDSLTAFDIKSQLLKRYVYLGFMIGTPIVLFWNVFSLKEPFWRTIGIGYLTFCLIFIVLAGPIMILVSSNAWRTQDILYESKHPWFKRVEHQMQGMGAFGYNQRTVVVYYLTPLFMITSEVPNNIDKDEDWVKVDKYVNELGLISP